MRAGSNRTASAIAQARGSTAGVAAFVAPVGHVCTHPQTAHAAHVSECKSDHDDGANQGQRFKRLLYRLVVLLSCAGCGVQPGGMRRSRI